MLLKDGNFMEKYKNKMLSSLIQNRIKYWAQLINLNKDYLLAYVHNLKFLPIMISK